jgi:antitoxin Phd
LLTPNQRVLPLDPSTDHPRQFNDLDWLDKKGLSMEWRLADAKNRLSELVSRALTEGPQRVTRRGDTVIVVSQRDYERLTGKRPDFKQFLIGRGPSLEQLNLTRDRSSMRDVKQ